MGNHQNPHAIMISLHMQGHINPFVQLAIKLALKGVTVTFVHTEHVSHAISKSNNTSQADIFDKARKSGLDINYRTISDGLPQDFDRSVNVDEYLSRMLDTLPIMVDQFIGKMVQLEPLSSLFLITDSLSPWSSMIAIKHNIVNVSFWTQPALAFTLLYHLDLLVQNGHVASTGGIICEETIDYIPGVRAIESKDLMSYLQGKSVSASTYRIAFTSFSEIKKADFILCNTIQELEPEIISAMNEKQPFYGIGPLLPVDFTNSLAATSLLPESDCTEWLNAKPHGSVLYVSFGSLVQVSKNEFLEIALGLLHSNVNFLWAYRPGLDGAIEILPREFNECLKDRGLIVPWCSQTRVLSNQAIGGFLTHCGWNSTLESIWCGVPLLCFPFLYDQIPNRKLLVQDWKIGINLCDKESVTREEVAEKIKVLMSGKTSDELRKSVRKIRSTLENALAANGASQKSFDQFIRDLKCKLQQKNGLACQ